MQNPEQEARQIVRSLCQGTVDEQRRTLDRFFTPDFAFVHPFCAVPPFAERQVPVLGFRLGSRDVARAIFQWYRMLSPKIEIEIDSVLHDKTRDKLYLDIRQIFSVWFIPAYHARVRLVTVLDLIPAQDNDDDNNNNNNNKGHSNRADSKHSTHSSDVREPLDKLLTSPTHQDSDQTLPIERRRRRRWLIGRQEDLYQVNEFLRFAGPTPLPLFWFLFQLGATAICVVLARFVRLSPWAWGQKDPAEAGVEAYIQVRDTEAEDSGNGHRGDVDGNEDAGQEQNGPAKHAESGKNGTSNGAGDADGATNGHRRTSSTHSQQQPQQQQQQQQQQQTPKKPWKNGGSARKR